ncbi:MAG: glyoxylase I family protein [Granulosicoccus sp.]|jgi:glyoxylase I family protein
MTEAYLEHTNLTVNDPDETARLLVEIFGWRIRWSGEAIYDGYSVHVGGEQSYLALYTLKSEQAKPVDSYRHLLGLNHLGIVVNDLDAAEQAILAAGFQTRSHANYEPGRRFYFEDNDGLEFEVISYH